MTLQDDILKGESSGIEFKEKIPKDTTKMTRPAVAFSNTRGGLIVLGVTDDRKVIGVEGDPFKVRDHAVDIIVSGCEPTIVPGSYVTTIDGKNIVVIEIEAGLSRPYYLKGGDPEHDAYVRVDASNRLLSPGMLKELELEGARRSFDGLNHIGECGDLPDAISKICKYLSERNEKSVTVDNIVNMGLLNTSGKELIPTRGFMLLTTNPYYQARVECARFRGVNMIEFADRKEFSGSLMEQMEDSTEFVMNHINLTGVIKGLYREDIPEIPMEAVREIITNAIVHRSYSMDNNHTFVAVFDDRVEITSPGMMPYGISLENVMSGRSNPRNPLIARFFKEAGLVEGWGSGILRAFSMCEAHGLKRPIIQEIDEVIRVTIFRKDSQHTPSIDVTSLPLSDVEKEIIEAVKDNPYIKIHDLSVKLSYSEAQIKRGIIKLKDRGILVRAGAKQSSMWEIRG